MKAFVENLFKVEVALSLILSLSFLGLAMPYGFPIFFPLIIIFCLKVYSQDKFYFRLNIGFVVFYICVLFYLIGMIYSGGIIYDRNKAELPNIISISALLPIIMSFKKDNWKIFLNIHSQMISLVMLGVSILSFYKFYLLVNGTKIDFLLKDPTRSAYPWGTSLVSDYNMFSYAMFAGAFASAYCLSKSQSLISQFFYFFASSTMIMTIVWSGSRRGWIVLTILISLLICYVAIKVFTTLLLNKSFSKAKAIKKLVAIFIVLGLVSSLFVALSPRQSLQARNSKQNTESESYVSTSCSESFDSCLSPLDSDGSAIPAYLSEGGEGEGSQQKLPSSYIKNPNSQEFSKLKSRFSTIYGQNSNVTKSFSSRTMLWGYANTLISNYSIWELLFGKGFDYITAYGVYVNNNFSNRRYVVESYPHNPVISAVHYSGLIGAGFVTLLIIMPILNLYKQRKIIVCNYLLALYVVSLLFLTISSNSVFSIKPFLLLIAMGISWQNVNNQKKVGNEELIKS